MARFDLTPLICTPEVLIPSLPCLICGKSHQQLLAAFDAFLCASLRQSDCSASALLPHGRAYASFSERELAGATAYLWGVFLAEELGAAPTDEELALGVSPFLSRSEIEILAMQLWLLCAMTLGPACDPTSLINGGRCYCVSLKDLLAIRVYLLGIFVNNFVVVNMTPAVLRQHVRENVGRFSISTLEAATAWSMCELFNAALNNQPT